MIFNNEKNIIRQIERMASCYTPEWVFDPKNPDLGGAFALTFAYMLAETGRLYDSVWDKQYASFLRIAGVEPLEEQAAEGIVVFRLSPGAPEGNLVPSGTILFDETGEISFSLQQSLSVTPMQMQSVFCTWGKRDIIYQAADGTQTKPFALFDYENNENIQEHVLYIGHDVAFCIRHGALIEMSFSEYGKSGQEKLADPKAVCWEYYADGWTCFDAVDWLDGKLRLLVSGRQPFQKTQIFDVETFLIRCRCLSIHEGASIFVDHVRLHVQGETICPQKVYHGDVEQVQSGFYPFGKSLLPFDAFYLACDEVFVKKGALVEMVIETAFHLCEPDERQEGKPIRWKAVMNKSNLTQQESPAARIAEAIIEYWNGRDFVLLPLTDGQNGLFQTDGEAGKKTLRFICPGDMEEATFNGFLSRWLRIRLIEISHFSGGLDTCYAPYWKDICFRYEYRQDRLHPSIAFTKNNVRTVDLKETDRWGQLFTPFEVEEPAIWFGFSKSPEPGRTGLLVVNEFPAEQKRDEITCRSFTASGWENVEITDETDHLAHTGLLTLTVERQWKQEVFFGETCCWMKLNHRCEDEKEPEPVFIREIFINAGRIVCTNKGGNMAEHTITKMPVSIGHISHVTNPFPITGGRVMESFEEMKRRAGAKLRHRQRAVTASDFEALAFEATGELLACKCFENINNAAEKETGAVTLVCQTKDYYLDGRDADVSIQKIKRYIQKHCLPFLANSGKLSVIETICVELCIRVDVTIDTTNGILRMEENIAGQLKDFLHPVNGNFQGRGFGIGEIPDEKTIEYFLYMTGGVKHIKMLHIRGFILRKGKWTEINLTSFTKKQFAAVKSGRHRVTCNL